MTPDEELADLQKKYALLGASTWRRPLVSPRVTEAARNDTDSSCLHTSRGAKRRRKKGNKSKHVL